MNYEVIKDKEKFLQFINWLPELKENETFYVALLARNKYIRDLGIGTFNSDRYQCKRFLATKETLYYKVKQLECEVGSYMVKGKVVPQEALALYITPNPRDLVKATKASLVKFAELVASGSVTHNPHQEVISQVHKSIGTKWFVDFDFDNVFWNEVEEEVNKILDPFCYNVLQTRGGFHLIVNLMKLEPGNKTWYPKLKNLNGVDVVGDTLLPVSGCVQGNFVPHFVV